MAKFVFELEAVLEQRRGVERTKQLAVAAVDRQRIELEQRLAGCRERLDGERRELREELAGGGSVDMGRARRQAGATLHVLAEAQRTLLQLAGVQTRLEAARRELIEATTRRRAVEVLRERRFEEWKREESRRDAAAVDELAVMRAARPRDEVAEATL